jgi:hypothetical protein
VVAKPDAVFVRSRKRELDRHRCLCAQNLIPRDPGKVGVRQSCGSLDEN